MCVVLIVPRAGQQRFLLVRNFILALDKPTGEVARGHMRQVHVVIERAKEWNT